MIDWGRLVLDAPVSPDRDTAARWARDELAKPPYHQTESLLDRFLSWLGSLFDGASVPAFGLPGPAVALIAVLVLALVAGLAFWLTGPVRLRRRADASAVVLGADARTAAQLRAAADAHAARGDWQGAVLDRFRALVRALEERTVLDDRPGRTAFEAAQAAGARLPGHAGELRRAGLLFDDVCYGKVAVGPDSDAWLRELDATLTATRPLLSPTADRSLAEATP